MEFADFLACGRLRGYAIRRRTSLANARFIDGGFVDNTALAATIGKLHADHPTDPPTTGSSLPPLPPTELRQHAGSIPVPIPAIETRRLGDCVM